MNDKHYIAITIGPVFDTMSLVSTPAALWASSYMFSYIAGGLRKKLIEDAGVDPEDFVTPYLQNDDVLKRNPGVGMLHDHIIFKKPEKFSFDDFKKIKECVIEDVSNKFHICDIEFLSEYVMISAVEFEADNPIMGSEKLLNSLELEKAFVSKEKQNPLLEYFTNKGNDEERNEKIKNSVKGIIGDGWQLLDSNSDKIKIRDLEDIARAGTTDDYKRHRYYAIVRSDGDNVGKTISELKTHDQFHRFSGSCIKFCEQLAGLVKNFNGVTIFAGGDDLLAILPCESNGGKHLFRFVRRANELFKACLKEMFDEANAARKQSGDGVETFEPSLTFGITITHYKYPLYEALEDSAYLLFDAKKKSGYKNAVSMRLIKHSGKTSTVWIKNDVLAEDACNQNQLISMLDRAIADADGANELLLSAFHKIKMFEGLFNSADANTAANLFNNTFDAMSHTGNDFLHKELPELFKRHILNGDIFALDADGNKVFDDKVQNYAAALNNLMRIVKFYVEKVGEER